MHSIIEIVENYTEKCAITSIRVDESTKKLIIEPKELETAGFSGSFGSHAIPHKQELPFEAEYIGENSLTAVIIKQEPGLMIEESSFNEDDSMTFNDGTEQDEDEKDFSGGETSQQYYGGGDSSEPGTSTGLGRKSSPNGRSRSQPNEGEQNKQCLKLFRKRFLYRLMENFLSRNIKWLKNAPCRCEKS